MEPSSIDHAAYREDVISYRESANAGKSFISMISTERNSTLTTLKIKSIKKRLGNCLLNMKEEHREKWAEDFLNSLGYASFVHIRLKRDKTLKTELFKDKLSSILNLIKSYETTVKG